ncbi:MAG: recombinase family protein [Clostridia bacterium]|nr:recombinase family protein [Clostridia bacterium]
MKTAAAYIRVSDERQDEFSPDSQLKLIREYCNRNDIILPEEFIFYDDGISAKSVKKREQFNEMIALAKQKEKPFQIILVWKFSRFARNQEESIVYKSLLRKNGVDVISISEPIQDNPFGGLIERIIEWMDEYYLIRLSDEVRRGMTERAMRGLPNAAPPFGYKMENGRYIIVEEEAKIVKEVFRMFLDGMSIRTIASYFSKMGIKTKHGNPIENRTVEYMLNNPVYIGYVRWNPNGRSASARNYHNPEDILKKAEHSPIINDHTFQQVKEKMEERNKIKGKYMHENATKHEYIFRGIVKCHSCGSTLIYQPKVKSLQCHKYSKGACPVSHSITESSLVQMVIEEMKRSVQTLDFNIKDLTQKQIRPALNTINYDSLIATERLKLERARQAYQEGVDSLQEYKTAKIKIEWEIKKLQKEKQTSLLQDSNIDLKKFAESVSSVIFILESNVATPELKNQALKSIVQKIILYKPEKRIELFFYI